MFRRTFSVLFLLGLAPAFPQNLTHVKVEMLAEQNTLQAGGSVTLGFHFHLQKGWHIYWQNPGDSGQAPSISWTLPDGFTAGDILWPVPQRLPLNSLADYGYTNEVLLMVPIQAPANLKPGRLVRIGAHLRWLVCNEICIPGDMTFNQRLLVKRRRTVGRSRNEYLFQGARRNQPRDLPEEWSVRGSVGKKDFRIEVKTDAPLAKTTTALFIPLHPNQIENGPEQVFRPLGSSFQLTVRKSDQLAEDLKTLEGILVIKEKKSTKGYNVSIPILE